MSHKTVQKLKKVLKYTLTRLFYHMILNISVVIFRKRQKHVVNHQAIIPSRGVLMYIYLLSSQLVKYIQLIINLSNISFKHKTRRQTSINNLIFNQIKSLIKYNLHKRTRYSNFSRSSMSCDLSARCCSHCLPVTKCKCSLALIHDPKTRSSVCCTTALKLCIFEVALQQKFEPNLVVITLKNLNVHSCLWKVK